MVSSVAYYLYPFRLLSTKDNSNIFHGIQGCLTKLAADNKISHPWDRWKYMDGRVSSDGWIGMTSCRCYPVACTDGAGTLQFPFRESITNNISLY